MFCCATHFLRPGWRPAPAARSIVPALGALLPLTGGRPRFHAWSRWPLIGILMMTPILPRAETFTVSQLQAVFLLRFGSFVEWPDEAVPAPGEPFVIGLLGRNLVGGILDQIIPAEAIDGHRVKVVRYEDVSEIGSPAPCAILFISRSEQSRLPAIMQALRDRPILTVSDIPGFARYGGMVTFMREHNRVQLRINLTAVRTAGLNVSSKLLRTVELVDNGDGYP